MIDLYIFTIVLIIWVLFVMYATCEHIYIDWLTAKSKGKDGSRIQQNYLLNALSLVSNYRQSIRVNTTNTGGNGDIMGGIRVLSHIWLIHGHFCLHAGLDSNNTALVIYNCLCKFVMALIFLLEGRSSGQWFRRQYDNKMRQTFTSITIRYYFDNLMRIVPIYYLSLYFAIVYEKYMIPAKFYNTDMVKLCTNQWIYNALFIANLPHYDMCMRISWSHCVTMQLYFVTPIFMYIMFRNRKAGIMAIISGIALLLITSMSIIYVNGFTFGLYGWSRTSPSLYNMVLIKPFEHGVAYMTGMFMGYMFADNQYYLRLRAYRLWPKIIIWSSVTMASTYALNVIGLPVLFSGKWLSAYVAIERAYTSVYWALMAACAIVTVAEYDLCRRVLSHRWWRPLRTSQHSSFLFHWFLSNTVFGSVVGDVSGRALYGYPIIWAVIALNYAIMIVVSAVFALPFDRLGRSLTAYVFAGQRLAPKPATGALKAD